MQNYVILSCKQAYVREVMAIYDEATATQNSRYMIKT